MGLRITSFSKVVIARSTFTVPIVDTRLNKGVNESGVNGGSVEADLPKEVQSWKGTRGQADSWEREYLGKVTLVLENRSLLHQWKSIYGRDPLVH